MRYLKSPLNVRTALSDHFLPSNAIPQTSADASGCPNFHKLVAKPGGHLWESGSRPHVRMPHPSASEALSPSPTTHHAQNTRTTLAATGTAHEASPPPPLPARCATGEVTAAASRPLLFPTPLPPLASPVRGLHPAPLPPPSSCASSNSPAPSPGQMRCTSSSPHPRPPWRLDGDTTTEARSRTTTQPWMEEGADGMAYVGDRGWQKARTGWPTLAAVDGGSHARGTAEGADGMAEATAAT